MNFSMLKQALNSSLHFLNSHKTLLKVLIGLAWLAILIVILRGAWQSRGLIIPYLKNVDFGNLWKVIATYLIALFLAAFSWSAIFHSMNKNVSYSTNMLIYLLTIASSRLPGTVWYIGGRIAFYSRLNTGKTQVLSATGIEFIMSFIANGIVAALLLPFGFDLPLYFLIPLVVVSILGLVFLHPKSITVVMKLLKQPLISDINAHELVIWVLLRTLLVLTGGLMIYFIITLFIPEDISLIPKVLGARALSGAAGLLTHFLPSSMGASDITLLSFLSGVIPASLAVAVAIIIRLFTSLMEFLAGLASYLFVRISPKYRNLLGLDKAETTATNLD